MVKSKGIKRFRVPSHPFESERLMSEMMVVGKYGLRNKRELWVIQKMCDDVKIRAKDLLICPNEQEFVVSSRRLLKRLIKLGVFDSDVDFTDKTSVTNALEKILDLTPNAFLERRLQHRVYELGLASSVHQARFYIHSRRVRINGDIVNKPGYLVEDGQDGYIEVVKKAKDMQPVEQEE